MTSTLLFADEPLPFGFQPGSANSPYFIVCDHASSRVPRALGSLGLAQSDLERHIGWLSHDGLNVSGHFAILVACGVLLDAVGSKDTGVREAWRAKGAAFFQRRGRKGVGAAPVDGSGAQAEPGGDAAGGSGGTA